MEKSSVASVQLTGLTLNRDSIGSRLPINLVPFHNRKTGSLSPLLYWLVVLNWTETCCRSPKNSRGEDLPLTQMRVWVWNRWCKTDGTKLTQISHLASQSPEWIAKIPENETRKSQRTAIAAADVQGSVFSKTQSQPVSIGAMHNLIEGLSYRQMLAVWFSIFRKIVNLSGYIFRFLVEIMLDRFKTPQNFIKISFQAIKHHKKQLSFRKVSLKSKCKHADSNVPNTDIFTYVKKLSMIPGEFIISTYSLSVNPKSNLNSKSRVVRSTWRSIHRPI